MVPAAADEVVDGSGNRKRSRPSQASLTRQVSHEALASADIEKENTKDKSSGGRGSPVRCVSEFDKVAAATAAAGKDDRARAPIISDIPPLPIPLHHPKMLAQHTRALRLEADLQPMRLILSRLMAHPTYNRKGVFNSAVDPVALGLPDYFSIVTKPMDLGTIKARLHAVAYQSQSAVAQDIRLVFQNAVKYNPAHNGVHVSARALLVFFDDQYRAFVPEAFAASKPSVVKTAPVPVTTPSVAPSIALATTQQDTTSAPVKNASLSSIVAPSVAPLATSAPVKKNAPSASTPEKNMMRYISLEAEAQLKLVCEPTCAATSSAPITTVVAKPVPPSVHTQGTRTSTQEELLSNSLMSTSRKRKKRGTKSNPLHSCQWCEGRSCLLCKQGCLHLEPTLLICNGPHCAGARIRKSSVYYIAQDGSRQYCDRCHTGLPAVLPHAGQDDACRYKRDLLKRKNDEEVVERWLSCSKCDGAVHHVCAMHNKHAHCKDDYVCPGCVASTAPAFESPMDASSSAADASGDLYSFVTGEDLPMKMSDVAGETFRLGEDVLSADALEETDVSSFIQSKVRERMVSGNCANAERTIVVRIISDCNRFFKVPEVVRTHFRMAADEMETSAGHGTALPPTKVNYRSKAIALFQKVDGLDVCIFCMYVQEYSGDDEYDSTTTDVVVRQNKRVYIAYLDSVEHFRPRPCRTSVYHEMLVSYLATARKRGFETAHIWACPPARGNSFVFWNHPASQRTPSRERLVAWYHGALSRAIDCGIVTDVKSLYETDFEQCVSTVEKTEDVSEDATLGNSGRMLCPPLLEGDFWMEEAARVHNININRNVKAKALEGEVRSSLSDTCLANDLNDRCPARQVAALLRDRVMEHPSSAPFRRPVNTAALKLKDYHTIITKPMDLGTVYSRCVLGEYLNLEALVSDVELVFSNALRYNPKGHFVHSKAVEANELFVAELNQLASSWTADTGSASNATGPVWNAFANLSMSLDASLVKAAPDGGCGNSTTYQTTMHSTDDGDANTSTDLPMEALDLIGGGQEAVHRSMAGSDKWLLDKRNPLPPKGLGLSKKTGGRKKKKSAANSVDEPPAKRRRQSWLGEEVAAAVRRMRTSFFTCSLVAPTNLSQQERGKADDFASYTGHSQFSGASSAISSRIADARHALLEFSQLHSLEFDTLRRAKYSTATLLYHLHNNEAPGMAPTCSSCNIEIKDVRWHRIRKVVERRQGGRLPPTVRRKPIAPASAEPEELCSSCHSKCATRDTFIPLQVSFRRS